MENRMKVGIGIDVNTSPAFAQYLCKASVFIPTLWMCTLYRFLSSHQNGSSAASLSVAEQVCCNHYHCGGCG